MATEPLDDSAFGFIEESVPVERAARYYLTGSPGLDTKEIWLVLHGYGQLGRFFLRNFESAATDTRLFVAPEGLSRFYMTDRDPVRVGASWMTREDRENEIDTYLSYLGSVVSQLQLKAPAATFSVLGFSQGGATACRIVDRQVVQAERLIIWGSDIPPEIDLTDAGHPFRSMDLRFIVGDDDHLAKPAMVSREIKRLDDAGVEFSFIRYPGGHRMDAAVIDRIMSTV